MTKPSQKIAVATYEKTVQEKRFGMVDFLMQVWKRSARVCQPSPQGPGVAMSSAWLSAGMHTA